MSLLTKKIEELESRGYTIRSADFTQGTVTLSFNEPRSPVGSVELDAHEKMLVREGRAIDAIKSYRERRGVMLGDAKAVVDAFRTAENIPTGTGGKY